MKARAAHRIAIAPAACLLRRARLTDACVITPHSNPRMMPWSRSGAYPKSSAVTIRRRRREGDGSDAEERATAALAQTEAAADMGGRTMERERDRQGHKPEYTPQ